LEIKSRIYEQDRHLGQILASSRLALLGNGAYIIIGSDSSDEARSLGAEQGFKNVSSQLKHRLPGISQVYSCTQRQYDNVQKKFASENPGQEVQAVVFADDSNDRAADFINSLGEAGLNTEIHFGDD
jgi:hypothetical protein